MILQQLPQFFCYNFTTKAIQGVAVGYSPGSFICNHFNQDMHHVYYTRKRKREVKSSFQVSKNLSKASFTRNICNSLKCFQSKKHDPKTDLIYAHRLH